MKSLSIKKWEESDQPREKLRIHGKSVLTNSELLAILMGSGNKEESAVQLAQRILNFVGNNLNALYKLSITDLMKFKGIGEAKAISIIAAMEMGERQKNSEVVKKVKVTSANDIYKLLSPRLSHAKYEEIWCIFLNRNNAIVGQTQIGNGGITGVVADPKKIFIQALELLATSIILCHNHPSGNLTISVADKKLTNKVKEAGELLDIQLLDHVIIGENKYVSFAEKGLI